MSRRLGIYSDGQVPLGRLERDVLDVIWRDEPVDAGHVHTVLAAERRISLSTVQSTLERLHRKQLLIRSKRSRAYVYQAAVSRDALIGALVADLVHELSGAAVGAGVCGFLPTGSEAAGDERQVSEATLQRLERWIAEHRARRSEDADR